VLKWLQAGLPKLGERTTVRWLGSSAVDLNLTKVRAPFKSVQLLIVLEPRDVPWFWLFAHLRGRRDILIVRGQLQTAPQYEFDLIAPHTWSESERAGRADTRQWAVDDLETLNFHAPQQTRSLSRALAASLLPMAQHIQSTVWRFSTRHDNPHFELHVPLPNPKSMDAAQFFSALRTLGEQASKRP
jgi:hypothetical protein